MRSATGLTANIRCAFLLLVANLCSTGFAQTALPVYNVATYGATGNGTTDDSSAIQLAINAGVSGGGIVFFPAGTYFINKAVSDPNLFQHSLTGSGVNGSSLLIGPAGSLTLKAPVAAPFHAGTFERMTVRCSAGTAGGQAGIVTQDVVGVKFRDVVFANCGTGIDMQDVTGWTERNDFDDVTFYDCNVAVHFDRIAADQNVSYGYNHFRIWVNTDQSGGRIFWASGGANPYNSFFSVQGNIAHGTTVFDAHSDGYANSMYTNTYFVQLEDNGSANATSYIFDDHNVSGPNGEIQGVSQLSFGSGTSLAAPGSVSYPVTDLLAVPSDLGPFTTTANSADTISNSKITPGSACFVQPTNALGASLAGVYVSSISWSQAIVTHPAYAGAAFRLWCHP